MKILIKIVIITCGLCINSKAQTITPTRINLLNPFTGTDIELKTTLDEKKPLSIKARTWVVIQLVGDSLGVVVDNRSYFLHFKPNKQYYFILQPGHYSSPVMTERSEQEFLMTAALEPTKGPVEYTPAKRTN